MRGTIIVVAATLMTMASNANAKVCTYGVSAGDVRVEWTAFKTTAKAPVKGTFNQMTLAGPTSAQSLKGLAKGLSITIDGASVESNNPGRNVTLSQFFFQKFAPTAAIKASVVSLEGDDTKGTLNIAVTLNGVSKTLPFAYTVEAGVLQAKATMSMRAFALKAAFKSLHNACASLHTGSDGVSKTWDDVELALSSKFTKTCK